MRLINSLKNRFNLKPPACAGLHITATSLQLLQLSKAGDEIQVNQYAQVSLRENAINAEAAKESTIFIQAVKKLNANIQQVAIALPEEAIISKTIQLSSTLTESELTKIIPYELEQNLPYPLQELNYDFQVSNKKNKWVDVLLVATQKQKLEPTVNKLAAAGLQVIVAEAETHAIERASQFLLTHWQHGSAANVIATILVNKASLMLMVWRDHQIIFSRSETMPNTEQSLPLIMLYIRRSLQFFLASAQAATIEQFIVLDENGFTDDLVANIQMEFRVAVNKADLPVQFHIEKKLSRDFLICFGLALRGVKQ